MEKEANHLGETQGCYQSMQGCDKDNKKSSFKYISSKRKARLNENLLLNEVSALVTKETGKTELLNAFFWFSLYW